MAVRYRQHYFADRGKDILLIMQLKIMRIFIFLPVAGNTMEGKKSKVTIKIRVAKMCSISATQNFSL